MDEKGLGQRLQEARRKAGLTQQMLCHTANISYSTLAKIERGAIKSPSIFTIQSLTNALGISLDDLMGTGPAVVQPIDPGVPRRESKNGIKFVYFDVNGCLVHFFQRAFTGLARETGMSADAIEKVFWSYNDAVCRGAMSMNAFNGEMARSLGAQTIDWREYWVSSVEPVEGMNELVHWTAENYNVGLLTNIMPGFLDALHSRGRLPDVPYDVVIDSSQVGAIKPERRIFEIAAERSGFQPNEILLIDDDRSNIMAADQLGWHVLWYDDYQPVETIERIRETLELLP